MFSSSFTNPGLSGSEKLNRSITEAFNLLNSETFNTNIFTLKSLACIDRSIFSFSYVNLSTKRIALGALLLAVALYFLISKYGFKYREMYIKKPIQILFSLLFILPWIHIFFSLNHQYGFLKLIEKTFCSVSKKTLLYMFGSILLSVIILGLFYLITLIASYLNVNVYMTIFCIVFLVVEDRFRNPYSKYILFLSIFVAGYLLYSDIPSIYSFIGSTLDGFKTVITNVHVLIIPIFASSVIFFTLVNLLTLFLLDKPNNSVMTHAFRSLVPSLTVIPMNQVLFLILYFWAFKVFVYSNVFMASALFSSKKASSSYNFLLVGKLFTKRFGLICLNSFFSTSLFTLKQILEAFKDLAKAISMPILSYVAIEVLSTLLIWIDSILVLFDIDHTLNFSIMGSKDILLGGLDSKTPVGINDKLKNTNLNNILLKYNFPRLVYSFLKSAPHRVFIILLINLNLFFDSIPSSLIFPLYTLSFTLFSFYYIVQAAIISNELYRETSDGDLNNQNLNKLEVDLKAVDISHVKQETSDKTFYTDAFEM